jgi:hypothetical protein
LWVVFFFFLSILPKIFLRFFLICWYFNHDFWRNFTCDPLHQTFNAKSCVSAQLGNHFAKMKVIDLHFSISFCWNIFLIKSI